MKYRSPESYEQEAANLEAQVERLRAEAKKARKCKHDWAKYSYIEESRFSYDSWPAYCKECQKCGLTEDLTEKEYDKDRSRHKTDEERYGPVDDPY